MLTMSVAISSATVRSPDWKNSSSVQSFPGGFDVIAGIFPRPLVPVALHLFELLLDRHFGHLDSIFSHPGGKKLLALP